MAAEDKQSNKSLRTTLFWLTFWYATSLVTLFMNKIILSMPGGDIHLLGVVQMITTASLGALKVFWHDIAHALFGWRVPKSGEKLSKNNTFVRDMILVGLMRGATVLLGLLSLAHVAVSFTETIKASAPFFTVLFARLILKERTPWPVMLSLIPVMFGLVLCSAYELSFDAIGFGAAALNNCVDCVQNVFSKHLLNSMTPVQLQFYTSISAIALQMPYALYNSGPRLYADLINHDIDTKLWMYLLIDATSYHLQSVSAYYTMSCMSPVSQSVANTMKRAFLIWISILYFGNPITRNSILGMILVIAGVFGYNHIRRREAE